MNLKLKAVLEEMVGGEEPIVVSAPGRVNLVGEHTDYNGGLVLPMAISSRTYAAFQVEGDSDSLVLTALDYGKEILEVYSGTSFPPLENGGWRNYALGVIEALVKRGLKLPRGHIAIAGDVPQGSGLSSSASFEVALASLLCEVSGFMLSERELALVGQEAEHTHAGCACGLMDQWIAAGARDSHAMLIDFTSNENRHVIFPKSLTVLVIDSGIRRELASSAYNRRRDSCEAVAKHLSVRTLSELSLEQLRAAAHELADVDLRRARHVITENSRTRTAVAALENGDYASLFEAINGSHASLRDDFEVTVPETDFLVSRLQHHLSGDGGARMTGGGFGGCVIAVGRPDLLANAGEHVSREYLAEYGIETRSQLYRAHEGARLEEARL